MIAHKLKMSDILIEGAVLKARVLSNEEVKEILRDVEKKQREIRKQKEYNPEEMNKIINL